MEVQHSANNKDRIIWKLTQNTSNVRNQSATAWGKAKLVLVKLWPWLANPRTFLKFFGRPIRRWKAQGETGQEASRAHWCSVKCCHRGGLPQNLVSSEWPSAHVSAPISDPGTARTDSWLCVFEPVQISMHPWVAMKHNHHRSQHLHACWAGSCCQQQLNSDFNSEGGKHCYTWKYTAWETGAAGAMHDTWPQWPPTEFATSGDEEKEKGFLHILMYFTKLSTISVSIHALYLTIKGQYTFPCCLRIFSLDPQKRKTSKKSSTLSLITCQYTLMARTVQCCRRQLV